MAASGPGGVGWRDGPVRSGAFPRDGWEPGGWCVCFSEGPGRRGGLPELGFQEVGELGRGGGGWIASGLLSRGRAEPWGPAVTAAVAKLAGTGNASAEIHWVNNPTTIKSCLKT